MKNWMERNHVTRMDVICAIIIASCMLMLLGANLARKEIERRVIEEQMIYVEPDGSVLVEYKGETYKHY